MFSLKLWGPTLVTFKTRALRIPLAQEEFEESPDVPLFPESLKLEHYISSKPATADRESSKTLLLQGCHQQSTAPLLKHTTPMRSSQEDLTDPKTPRSQNLKLCAQRWLQVGSYQHGPRVSSYEANRYKSDIELALGEVYMVGSKYPATGVLGSNTSVHLASVLGRSAGF